MSTIYILKIIFAAISFSILATWYILCWLYTKNDKFEKPVLILTFVLAGISILACIITSMSV